MRRWRLGWSSSCGERRVSPVSATDRRRSPAGGAFDRLLEARRIGLEVVGAADPGLVAVALAARASLFGQSAVAARFAALVDLPRPKCGRPKHVVAGASVMLGVANVRVERCQTSVGRWLVEREPRRRHVAPVGAGRRHTLVQRRPAISAAARAHALAVDRRVPVDERLDAGILGGSWFIGRAGAQHQERRAERPRRCPRDATALAVDDVDHGPQREGPCLPETGAGWLSELRSVVMAFGAASTITWRRRPGRPPPSRRQQAPGCASRSARRSRRPGTGHSAPR